MEADRVAAGPSSFSILDMLLIIGLPHLSDFAQPLVAAGSLRLQ